MMNSRSGACSDVAAAMVKAMSVGDCNVMVAATVEVRSGARACGDVTAAATAEVWSGVQPDSDVEFVMMRGKISGSVIVDRFCVFFSGCVGT